MASILKSPIEEALSKAPAFGLPDTFQKSTEGRQQATFTPGNVPFQSEFNAASQRYGVPVNVLMALAQQESSFNPTALGQPTKYGRAKGLMQYIDSTASGMGINPYDPLQSIDAAAKQLRTRLDKGYSMQEAVQAHFGGDDRKQWGEKTRAYGVEVMGKAQRFFDGTTGPIKQGTQQQPAQRDYAAEYPAAQSGMENMQQTELRTRAQRMDKLLGDLNADEPGRFRELTPEEVQQYMASQAKTDPQQPQPDQQQLPTGDNTAVAEATQRLEDGQQKVAEQNKGIIDSALDAISDAGQLTKSGINIAAQDARELVSRIPYIGKSIVEGADSVDRWMNGKGSEEIFKEWDKNVEKNLSPEMVNARKKAWVVEPGDDLGNGKKATSYSFGPAWSDPRAYASGILESLPEMAVTMGGAGRLAQFAYKRAIVSGMSREAAAKVASRTAMVAGGLLEGGLGGASSARETREQILKMNPEQLKDSAAMRSLMEAGKSFEDARKEVAENAASQAFLLAGVGTGIFGGMGDRAMAKIITGNSGRLKAAITGFIGEGLFEEVPQSALQQMGQNYAMQEADPNTPLMKGVANQAAGGLAVGGLMGAGMGVAAPRAGEAQTTQSEQPTPQVEPVQDPAQATEEQAVAAAPTPSRDDTGLSDDAGPLERAVRGTQPQPDATNGGFWGGEPGTTINMQAKGDPDTAMVATVERYERDGSMTVRSEDGTPYTVTPDDVDIVGAATVQQSTSQQMQDAGTAQEVKDQRAAELQQEDPEDAAKRQDDIRKALEKQGVDPDTGEVLAEQKPARQTKTEDAPAERPLTDLSEDELRDRMRYIARQAKQSGWDTRLTNARRDVEKVLNAKVKEREQAEASSAAGNAEQQPGAEMAAAAQENQPGAVRGGTEGSAADRGAGLTGDVGSDTVAGTGRRVDADTPATVASANGGEALAGADNKPKWFSTAEKAQKHLDKRKLSGFSVVETKSNRFELHADGTLTNEGTTGTQNNDEVSATAPAPKTAQTPVNPRTNRAKKLVGEVGEIVSPDGDVGNLSAGGQYQITRIEKNGTLHVMNRETAGNTTITPAEMERARSRNVNWSKTDVPAAVADTVAKSAPAQRETQQGEDWQRFDDDSGTLLVPRSQMPQIKSEHRGALVNFLNARGIAHQEETVPASSLKATQAEYSPSRVARAAERTEGDRAILVDKTGQILDGHHQWMAAKEKGEDIRVIRFDGDILDLLKLGQEFPSSTIDASSASEQPKSETKPAKSASEPAKSETDPAEWQAQAEAALQRVPDDHPQKRKWAANVANGIKSESDRAGVLRQIEAAQIETASNEGAKPEVTAAKDTDRFADNKLFTADKVAAARARMKSKFGQLNSGLDPELLIDGMTIAGAYIESGVRKFGDYAKAMVDDFGDGVKPYLLSFWEGARNYPGLDNEGMTSVADSAAEHQQLLTPADRATPAVGEVVAKPATRTRKTGQKGDLTLTQDFGVDHIDGYGENTSGRETGSDLKDEFLKNGRAYLNAVADSLENVGFTPTKNAKGKFVGAVNVNAAGDAVSGDITLAMDGPNGTGIYMNVSGTSMRGMVPTTVSGVGIMYRTTKPDDKYGTRSTNQWAPVDLSANDLATLVAGHAESVAQRDAYTAEQQKKPSQSRTTSALDDMVSNFDAEVSNNGTATELGKPGESALEGVSTDPVRAAGEVREAERSPADGSAADGRGNEPAGRERNDGTRSVGDDTRTVSVPARGSEPAERGANAERGSTARDNGDAAGRGRVRPAAGVTAQEKPADLFTINADEIGQGGDKAKYANNVAAIRTLKQLESSNRQATADEQAILARYVGWGGLPGAFARTDGTANKGWEKQVAELKSLLTPDELAAAAASTRNAHYTSPEIVSGMWSLMERLGFTGGRVIEPSVGVGNFFGLMPQGVRKASALHGVELDRITSGIAKQLYPEAKIARMGYQEYTIPDGYFDAAVGNPPFGSEKLYDGNRKDLSGFSIHNYFFARTVDALRPGGVMAMVVTNRFLDATSDKARQYIADRADLLGAIRLPNNAFAKNAGTEVTTDIIVLQRRLPDAMPSGPSWSKIVDYTDKQGNTVPLNEYFSYRPEMMLGDFGAFGTMYRAGDTALVARDGQNTAQLLEQAISRFPANVMTPAVEVKSETRETVQAENVRVGSMFVDGSGRVMLRGEDELGERTGTAVEFRSAKAEERVKGMLRIRDSLSRLRQLQLSNTAKDAALDEARQQLNKTYDGFVKANGPINSQANKLLFRDDPTWPQISALEDSYDRGISADVAKRTGEEPRKQSATKAAIFTRRTQQPYSAPTSASTAKDALVATLAERGRVDMDMMASLYGKAPEAIAAELGDLLYNAPGAGWQTRDEYLSGNVKQKLAQAEAAAKTDPAYARNVEALREVQPKDIEAVDINVKPGATWIPTETMAAFADHIAESTGSKAFYNKLTAGWSFPKLDASSSATARYGTNRMSVSHVLEAAAAQKAVQIYDTHQDGSRTLNETETQLANDKVNQVKQEWSRWIWADDARRASLSRLYNDQFNTDVAREYDGSHLTLPGKVSDDIIRLRPHQNNFIWRVVQGGSTLADHVVGAGKTFSLIGAAMELRRMGLAQKPVFAVPNHLVGQWAQDFIKLYPGANVLAATKADFEKANRKRFFARIATGDWDAVIVAHSSFGKVAVKPETEAAFIKEEIADLTSSIEAIEEAEGKKSRNVKQAAERKAKMEERLKKLLDTDNKDDSLYWDDLGIDALFVDEAHEFKNLAYSSGMRGVAGMGNAAGSQKATDLYMKTRIVRDATGGRNVVFATGTPISNTMAEMYTQQRYLDYDNLKASGLAHFDAWARMFGEVVTDWELSPSGQYKMNSRFAKFVNMPELMQRYSSFADVINRDDINRQLAAQGKRLPVPKVKGGKPQNIVVARSSAQADYIGEPIKDGDGNDTDNFPEGTLVYRAENLPKKAEKGGDNMLKIMSDARKAALDMRLIDPDARDNPDSKVNDAANRIKADYDKWHADRGAQLVFIDLSTPKGARADEAARIRDLIERSESKDPDVADAAQAELDKISPDEIESLNAAFSVYDDLKQKLVDRGIPAAEIAFIHDAKTDLQKTDLFAKVRSGRIRVLLGSTAKMGAGMNVQERLVALHHLDAPWRPSDLEQREGRIIRQGNILYDRDPEGFEVGIYRYATKQTLDSRMWQTIEGKANFIEQVRKGATGTREIEDIGGEAANAAEMKAASSGNPLILEEMTLRQRIRTLENERVAHDRDQFRVRDRIRQEESNARVANRTLDELRQDAKLPQPAKFEVTIGGQVFDKRKDAGEAILATTTQMEMNGIEEQPIGTYGGFKLSLSRVFAGKFLLHVEGKGDYTSTINMENADATGTSMRMTNSVKDLDGAIEQMEEALARSQKAIPSLQEQVKAWPKGAQLDEAIKRHAEVIEKLRPKKKAAEQSVTEPATATQETQQDNLQSWSRIASGQRQASPENLAEMRRMRTQAVQVDRFAELVRRIEQQNRTATSNPQRVMAALRAAEISGEYDARGMQLAQWLLRQYPHLANTLSIELRKGSEDLPAGNYNVPSRIVSLYSNYTSESGQRVAGTDAVTAAHEIMHHIERMLPRSVQEAITERWFDAMKARLAEYNAAGQTAKADLLADLVAGMYGDRAGLERARQAMLSGELPGSDYQFASPSEYWAENGARIIADRKAEADRRASRNWVDKAVDVMRSIIAKVRSLVGRKADTRSELDDALDSVLAGDGRYQENATILNRVGDDLYGLTEQFNGDYQVANMPQMRSGMKPQTKTPTEAQDNARVRGWWDKLKNLPADTMTDLMQKGLAVVPMRPLVLELGRNLPAAAEYMRLKQSMDAMRNTWHARTDAVAQRWLKYRKSNKDENVTLMDLMHDATIQQVDPSQGFIARMTDRDRDALRYAAAGSDKENELLKKAAEDKKRREAWNGLNARYKQLSPEAQSLFKAVRDEYSALADAYEKVLMGNMEKAINVRIKKAEREHRYELQRITDEGLTGQEKQDATDEANRRLKIAKTKTAWNRKARITQLRQQFEMERLQGPYFPLARFGNLFVTVRNAETGAVESFSRFEKAAEQREFADLMRKDKKYTVQVGALDDTGSARKAVDANFVADVEDILADLPNAEQVKDEVWQRYLESLPDFSIRKNRIHRTGRKGFISDALRAYGNNMFHGSHQLARLAHTFDMEEALDASREEAQHSKDPVRDGLVVNEIEKRHEFVMNPKGGPLVAAISQAAFIYALAASPKAAIVNLSQTAIMGVPILGAYDGSAMGMTRAANQLMRALGDFTRGKGHAKESKRLTDDERRAIQEAYDTGIIDRTQSHDLAGVGETGVEYNPARAKVMAIMAWGFHHGERLNREVTFLASYRMARAKGLPHKEAVQKANDLTWKTHFDYQNTSRPRVMHSDTMKALLVFRNFTINMLWRLFRDLHQATKGESPEVRREARIQVAGTTGMMMLSAGITGTWFFGIAMMLGSMFMDDGEDPEAELKKNMIEALGPQMAGIILDGVPGYLTGTNMSDSIGMRDLWFRSPSTELEGKNEIEYWKSQLLGAPPSMAENVVRGFQMINEGEYWRGIENIMPKFLKDPMKAARYATEGAKNKRGDVVVEDIDAGDVIRQALGFTPAKLAEQYDLNNAGYSRQQAILSQRKKLMDAYWKADEAGDDAKLDKLEADIDKYNEKYPEMEITPKSLSQSAKTREKNAEDATGGMRYNRKLRDRILDEQSPTVYR